MNKILILVILLSSFHNSYNSELKERKNSKGTNSEQQLAQAPNYAQHLQAQNSALQKSLEDQSKCDKCLNCIKRNCDECCDECIKFLKCSDNCINCSAMCCWLLCMLWLHVESCHMNAARIALRR